MTEDIQDDSAPKTYLDRLIARIWQTQINEDAHTVSTLQATTDMLDWIVQILKRQQMAVRAMEDYVDPADNLRDFQTLIFHPGRQQATALLTQLLADKNTLLFEAPAVGNLTEARGGDLLPIDPAVYNDFKQCTLIKADPTKFFDELAKNQHETVIIFGTIALSKNIGENTTAEYTTKTFRDQLYTLAGDKVKHVLIIS